MAVMAKKPRKAASPFSDAKAFLQKQYKEEAFEDASKLTLKTTGSIALDWVFGGGLAGGRIYELYGAEGSGKTTAALTAAKAIQKQGRPVFYVDFEHALDTDYARNTLGVSLDPDHWLLVQPNTAEAGLDMAIEMVDKFSAGLVIVDSVAAMVPKSEFEGDVSDLQVGAQARVMGKAMRKLTGVAHRNDTAIIFINQVRDKIGGFGYGDPTTTPGGRALKFFASGRIQMKKFKTLDDGVLIQAQIKKSKITSSQKRKAKFTIRSGVGVDFADEIVTLGVEMGVIKKPNSQTHKFPHITKPIPKGAAVARRFLRKPKNKNYSDLLKDKIVVAMLEDEKSNLEIIPNESDTKDTMLDIDADLASVNTLDDMDDADWIVTKLGKKEADTDSVDTEDIEDTEGD